MAENEGFHWDQKKTTFLVVPISKSHLHSWFFGGKNLAKSVKTHPQTMKPDVTRLH